MSENINNTNEENMELHHEHDCDCGCGCDHDHETEKMTLVLDDDTELTCDVLGVFEVEETEYIALLPEGDEEVLIYRYLTSDNEEGFELENIESDDEYDAVGDAFFDLFYDDEEIEFDDADEEE